jgi:glycogen debranching enzyme
MIPLLINRHTTFVMSDESGDIPDGSELGLYVDDTRIVRRYAITLDGHPLLPLTSHPLDAATAMHVLTNPALADAPRGSLSIIRRRCVGDDLTEDLEITNYGRDRAACSLELDIQPDCAHVITVRQALKRPGGPRTRSPVSPGSLKARQRVSFEHDGGDPRHHLIVDLCRQPEWRDGRWRFALRLAPRERWHLCVRLTTRSVADRGRVGDVCRRRNADDRAGARRQTAAMVAAAPRLDTDSALLLRAYERSVQDLAALRIEGEVQSDGEAVIAAGIPWFMALFGRDSLIAAYQGLPFYPDLAKGVLRSLARLQGRRVDPVRYEEPGKILHEHRPSAANVAQELIPGFPYFGTIDATPLFLVVLAATYRVTGDLDLVRSLRDNALRALEWLDRYGDRDGDGYLEYTPDGGSGLANHGWKDSADAIQFRDGAIARPPIALCEVQGYAYAARVGMAEVFDALGEGGRAARLRKDAAALRDRFERDFWMSDRGYYALALDGEKRQVDAIASNPGHLLWSGIVSRARAARVTQRLLDPGLFSGWGVRTLATGEAGYNPLSYHTGSVWPHDTGLIVAGLARYGFTGEAARLTDGLLSTLAHAPDHRLPEVFAGYGRAETPFPVDHPLTSRPQAWAAGTVLLLLSAMVGIDPSVPGLRGNAFLAPQVSRLSIDGLWTGRGRTVLTAAGGGAGAERRVDREDPGVDGAVSHEAAG